jgi:polysaccharide deacetylase 2 family uncharacterized protein YibQ
MTQDSPENTVQGGSAITRRATPRWIREAGHVALREVAALAVLALIIMSGFGWFWSDPLAFERADLEPSAPVAPLVGNLDAIETDFGRADPIQLGSIAPGAGGVIQPEFAKAGGGADIARQAVLPLWQRNAAAPIPAEGKIRIAIIIDDLGLDQAAANRVLELPGPLTLAVMSYAKEAPALAQTVRSGGHELLLHVPMEPEGGQNPGPHALTTGQTREEFDHQLSWALDRFEGYVGVNNHMGSRVTASTERMSWLFEELDRRGLMFVDSRTTKNTVAPVLAAHFGLPFAERDIFLDNEFGAEAVGAQLRALESEARKQGYAVGIGHPHRGTIAALKAWLPTLAAKGMVLVPISDIAASHQPETALSLN